MINDIKMVAIKDIANFQEGYVNPKQSISEYFDGPIKWLRATDLNDSFVTETSRTITEKGFNSAGKSATMFAPNTIAISKSGTIGRLGILKDWMCGNRAVINISPNEDLTDISYFFYCLKQKKREIVSFAQGSVQKNLYVSELSKLVIPFPHIRTQKEIGKILMTFDEKIELNQKMNETLEEIAKTLFKSWFIDFDPVRAKTEGRPTGLSKEISDLFPDSFENSELGEIPKGWQVLKIEDCCDTTDYVANGSFKTLRDNTNRVDGKEEDAAILIRVSDHNSNWNSEFQYIDDHSYDFLEKTKLFPEDLIICNVGDVGKCFLLPDLGRKMSLGPNGILCKNFEKKELISKEYLFYFLNNANTQNFLRSIATGSVQSKFNKTQFRSLQLVTPGDGLLNSFTGTTKEILKKKNLIFNENNILSKLRDTLLPKLISGELKIKDAENLVEKEGI